MRESFSSFGPNAILAAHSAKGDPSSLPGLMPQPGAGRLALLSETFPGATAVPVLYAVVQVTSSATNPALPGGQNVVAVGAPLADLWRMYPGWRLAWSAALNGPADCAAGSRVAARLQLHPGDELKVDALGPGKIKEASQSTVMPRFRTRSTGFQPGTSPSGDRTGGVGATSAAATETEALQSATCRVQTIVSTGASEDAQVFVPLPALQRLTSAQGKVSTVELHVPGNSKQVEQAIPKLAALFPGTDARPVRQIVYSEGKVLGIISRLMFALTALILIIIALCVMATMTAMLMERRKDIALMKALGASDRVVMEFFLSEAAALGFLGGFIGFGVGALLARDLAIRLFQVALAPSGWVFPLVCLCNVVLATAAAFFPVQAVRRIQPAVMLKGA